MFRKVTLVPLVLFGFVLSGMSEVCFADVSAKLEQTRLNIISLIQNGNYAEAQVQTQKLLAGFSEHKDIAKAVWEIAKKYDELEKYDKAFELNQYNIEHFPHDVHAVLSQVEIVKFHFRKGDDAAVDAAVSNFLSVFSKQPTLSKGLYHIARRYDEFKRYDKARQLHQYNVEHFPDDIHALWSQVEIISSHFRDANDAATDAAVNNLLTVFSKQPTLPKEVWQISKKYDQLKRYDKAFELNQYNIEHFPHDVHAVLSQVEIVKFHFRKGDNAAVDAAVSNFLNVFSGQPTLAKGLYHIARRYDEFKRYDKALQLHQYNVEHFPDDIHALWSQVEIISSHLRDANDAAADAAVGNLLTVFSGQPTLPKEIYQVAMKYEEFKRYDKARQLYQYNVEHFPNDIHAIWLQVEIIYSYLRRGDYAAADAAVGNLLTDFSGQPTLPKEIYQVARRYDELKKHDKAHQLYQYVIETWSTDDAIDSRKYVVMSRIALGYDEAAAAIDKLLTDFSGHPDLPAAVLGIAEPYYDEAFRKEAEGLDNQAKDYFQKALAIYEMVKNRFPGYVRTADTCCWTGACYRALGEYEKSIECYQKVVDDYPSYRMAWNALFLVGRNYESLKESGVISKSEADTKIKAAYVKLLEKYPDCKVAKIAQRWLSSHN